MHLPGWACAPLYRPAHCCGYSVVGATFLFDADAAGESESTTPCAMSDFLWVDVKLPNLSRHAQRKITDSEGEPERSVPQWPDWEICDTARNTRDLGCGQVYSDCKPPKTDVCSRSTSRADARQRDDMKALRGPRGVANLLQRISFRNVEMSSDNEFDKEREIHAPVWPRSAGNASSVLTNPSSLGHKQTNNGHPRAITECRVSEAASTFSAVYFRLPGSTALISLSPLSHVAAITGSA